MADKLLGYQPLGHPSLYCKGSTLVTLTHYQDPSEDNIIEIMSRISAGVVGVREMQKVSGEMVPASSKIELMIYNDLPKEFTYKIAQSDEEALSKVREAIPTLGNHLVISIGVMPEVSLEETDNIYAAYDEEFVYYLRLKLLLQEKSLPPKADMEVLLKYETFATRTGINIWPVVFEAEEVKGLLDFVYNVYTPGKLNSLHDDSSAFLEEPIASTIKNLEEMFSLEDEEDTDDE